jgi:hypothetical protein
MWSNIEIGSEIVVHYRHRNIWDNITGSVVHDQTIFLASGSFCQKNMGLATSKWSLSKLWLYAYFEMLLYFLVMAH